MNTLPAPALPAPRATGALSAFFQPRSVALIGASEQPGSVGRAVWENLLGFPGHVFAVNPRHGTMLGRTCYPNLSAVPENVDLAVVATPASSVPDVIADCGVHGIRAAIVLSAGFRETGAAGAERERRTLLAARPHGVRLLGPNCLGLINPHTGLNAAFAGSVGRPGSIAFVSQSGALCAALLDWSRHERIGLSALVSAGGMIDVGWGELLRHLGDDPRTGSIFLYVESIGDAADFLAAAREVLPRKPLVVLKPGRTAMSVHAAASHTGALAGRDDVFDAAMRQAGILRVENWAELLALAKMLAHPRPPAGRKLAIVTNAGGPGALAADALALGGGQLAALSAVTLHDLEEALPPNWSHGNPIDVLGDARTERFDSAIKLAIQEPASDATLVLLTPQAMTNAAAIAMSLVRVARTTTKPVLACWLGGDLVRSGREILRAGGLPEFPDPETAARAFNHCWRLAELRALAAPATIDGGAPPPAARKLIADVLRQGRRLLSEYESKELMRLHGIPCVETHLATTEDQAAAIAARMGFPVAVKLHSLSITHKSDVGGVRLDLHDAAAVRAAWRLIRRAVEAQAGRDQFLGVTVQPMVRGDGRELILGLSTDPQFGPVVLFGTGGRFVEVYADHALGLAPLTPAQARRMIAETKISRALRGLRGLPAVEPPLAEVVARFSQLPRLHPEIREVDLNPVVFNERGDGVALDARVILQAETPPAGSSVRAATP